MFNTTMNSTKNINNLLVITESNEYLAELYKLCLIKVQKGWTVLIITSKHYDFSPLLRKIKISKEQMKRLIVINYTNIDDVSNKLMDLHDWNILPSLVVVDVSGLISTVLLTSSPATSVMKSVCLCAVSFLDYLHSVALQKDKLANGKVPATAFVNGLFIVKAEGENFGASHLQLLRNLYFYNTELLDDVRKVSKLL